MRIAFLGLGLIAGSVARAVRSSERWAGAELVAWTPSGRGPLAALATGIVDAASADPAEALAGAGLVVLGAPPLGCIALVRRLGGDLRGALATDATVTDVASTKGALTRAAADAGVRFVGGHPMAGRETSGFDAADADLFRGRPWVVTEAVAGGDAALVHRLAAACGAVPVPLEAERHDRLVAAISHLPLLASVALVEAVAGGPGAADGDWPDAARLAASGWHGATRLARGDVTMGAEIAATNAAAIAAVLHRYRDRVDALLGLLEAPGGPDEAGLREHLAAARARLDGQD